MEHMDDRLSRIEAKLDKLSDAVVAIARTEEQIATIFSTQRAIEARLEGGAQEIARLRERTHDLTNQNIAMNARIEQLEDYTEDVINLKIDTHDNSKTIERYSKVVWAIGSTVIVAIVYALEQVIFG